MSLRGPSQPPVRWWCYPWSCLGWIRPPQAPAAGRASLGASSRARHREEAAAGAPGRLRGERDAAITGLPYRLGVSCIVAEKARQPHGGLK